MVRRRVVVTGQVQGVFFRDSTRTVAQQQGVAGWVTNRPDGSVEAELEGPEEDVETVVSWMRSGPQHARVDHVEVDELPERGGSGFSVR